MQRWLKMMPRCLQKSPRGSKTAPLVLQRAVQRLKFGSTKLSRQPFSTPVQDSQLTIRSLQLTRSTFISMELSRQLFRPQCKIHTSEFAVSRSQNTASISLSSRSCNLPRFATRCAHSAVNCPSFTIRSLLFICTMVVHTSPFTLCPAQPTLQSVHFSVQSSVDDSHFAVYTSEFARPESP